MSKSPRVNVFQEPKLMFGNGQVLESAKDGLYLFGPIEEKSRVFGLRVGVIGTSSGISHYLEWAKSIQGFIPALSSNSTQHRPFPGFASVFGIDFPAAPAAQIKVDEGEIDAALFIGDRHQALYKTVDVFCGAILGFERSEESLVDVWVVVVPERVHELGRPNSIVPKEKRLESEIGVGKKGAKSLLSQGSLFEEDYDSARPYYYEINFQKQLKARLIESSCKSVVQLVRETTIAPHAFLNQKGEPVRKPQDPATVAWNLCTTMYFKAGYRPWRLADVRPGVCYIGIVFKQVEASRDERAACCGAQMFLDSGDGVVFRGAVGPWRTGRKGDFHLGQDSAAQLIKMVVDAYKRLHGSYPRELFIHGKTYFNNEEWEGFQEAVPKETNIVAIRIRHARDFKLFRLGKLPVLRGTALEVSDRVGYLWTKGYVPYLKTYAGRETPNPLRIDIVRGEASITTVMKDVLGLTKLNFNACIYGDGEPVTLRFADSVGEILTAGPQEGAQQPLPFRHYI